MTKVSLKTFSPGKIILCGEHAVVYGYPAIVASIGHGVTVSLLRAKKIAQNYSPFTQHIFRVFEEYLGNPFPPITFECKSNLQLNSGMGGSAAYAYALLQMCSAVTHTKIDKETYYTLIQKCEIFSHGKPSGIDASAVVFQGCMKFQRVDGKIVRESIPILRIPHLFLLQSGQAVESTKEMVEYVSKVPHKETILKEIGEISKETEQDLRRETFHPDVLSKNERLLEKLGVVSEKARSITASIEDIGGYAKIIGAGGIKNGSGMILIYHDVTKILFSLAKRKHWQIFPVQFMKNGAIIL